MTVQTEFMSKRVDQLFACVRQATTSTLQIQQDLVRLSSPQHLSRAVTDVMWNQWRWLVGQCQFGFTMWGAVMKSCAARESVPGRKDEVAGGPVNLEQQTLERLRRGAAPPREIYDVQNRGRIDWSTVPDWARPSDPDLFEGCSHEG
jgi:hypothetical protein